MLKAVEREARTPLKQLRSILPLVTPPHRKDGKPDSPKRGSSSMPPSRKLLRRLLFVLGVVCFVLLLRRLGVLQALLRRLEPEALRELFESAGPFGGVALYTGAFALGEVLHLPGALFVAAGVLVWGCARRPALLSAAAESCSQPHSRPAARRLRSPAGALRALPRCAPHWRRWLPLGRAPAALQENTG
jgi:hypothetical protein